MPEPMRPARLPQRPARRPRRRAGRVRPALLALATAFAPAVRADCSVVFGQGRLVAADDAGAARMWDGVNRAFNGGVARALAERGVAVVPLVARVGADAGASVAAVLARAEAEGCGRIVETALFADDDAQALVARVREYPLLAVDADRRRIGPPQRVVEHQFDLEARTLDRVRPALLGERMAAELAARGTGTGTGTDARSDPR